MKKVVALKDGYYQGKRVRAGESFLVTDTAHGKWFVPASSYKAPEPVTEENHPLTMNQMNRRKAESFVEAMRRPAAALVEDTPEAKAAKAKRRKQADEPKTGENVI